jgi:hypothetical protein
MPEAFDPKTLKPNPSRDTAKRKEFVEVVWFAFAVLVLEEIGEENG